MANYTNFKNTNFENVMSIQRNAGHYRNRYSSPYERLPPPYYNQNYANSSHAHPYSYRKPLAPMHHNVYTRIQANQGWQNPMYRRPNYNPYEYNKPTKSYQNHWESREYSRYHPYNYQPPFNHSYYNENVNGRGNDNFYPQANSPNSSINSSGYGTISSPDNSSYAESSFEEPISMMYHKDSMKNLTSNYYYYIGDDNNQEQVQRTLYLSVDTKGCTEYKKSDLVYDVKSNSLVLTKSYETVNAPIALAPM